MFDGAEVVFPLPCAWRGPNLRALNWLLWLVLALPTIPSSDFSSKFFGVKCLTSNIGEMSKSITELGSFVGH